MRYVFFILLIFYIDIFASDFDKFYTRCITKLVPFKYLSNKTDKISGNYFNDRKNYLRYRAVNPIEFNAILDKFFISLYQSNFADHNLWLGDNIDFVKSFYNSNIEFTPYVQKLTLSHKDTIAIKGDLHGDIFSLIHFLKDLQRKKYVSQNNGFKIIDPNFKILFLGDYVDRGIYGIEVMYVLMKLKIENPDQVFLVRGNHEDIQISSQYGFIEELKNKFSDHSDLIPSIIQKLMHLYEFLPVALYIGSKEHETKMNYIQCCHGGLELGYNPQALFNSGKQYERISKLTQYSNCYLIDKYISNNKSYQTFKSCCFDYMPTQPVDIIKTEKEFIYKQLGFMWNDFSFNHNDNITYSARGIQYNKEYTNAILKAFSSPNHTLCGIIRAHQHVLSDYDKLMQQMLKSYGVARHWSSNKDMKFNFWDGIVCTLLLSPDGSPGAKSAYFKGFKFDTTLLLKPGAKISDWSGVIINNNVLN